MSATRSLRDDLASLKIERQATLRAAPQKPQKKRSGPRRSWGSLLLSLVLWVIPLGLVAGGGTYVYLEYDRFRPKPEVEVIGVQRLTAGEAEKVLSAKGYLRSRHQASVGAKSPGRIESIVVEEGIKVKKGDLIAVLEHSDLDATRDSRLAMLDRTKAELEEAKADLTDKERKYQRSATLFSKKHIPANEMDEAESEWKKCRARVSALEAGIKLMGANIREIEESINNMDIRAPFNGTIVEKLGEIGETIIPGGMGSGSSGRGSVVKMANLDELEVETDIAENLLSRIKIGQPAEISVSAVPERRYKGRLRKVIPMGDRSRGTVKVHVEVLDADDRLFPELVSTVHFLPEADPAKTEAEKARAAGLFLPKSAIVEEGGHAFVWVVDDKNRLHKTKVEVVITNDELARADSGLSGSETIVRNPAPSLKDGETVRRAR